MAGGEDATVFPQSISLAATFNAPLLETVAAAIGVEARGRRNKFERDSQVRKYVLLKGVIRVYEGGVRRCKAV